MATGKVKVTAEGTEFRTGLDKMRSDFSEFATGISEKAQEAGALIGISLGAEGLKSVVEHFSNVQVQADKFGETAEVIQRIGVVAKGSGLELDHLGRLMIMLQISTERQLGGLKEMSGAWQDLGIDAGKFAKAGMDEKLEMLAEGFAHAEEKGRGVAAVSELVGRNAGDLIPLLAKGSDSLKDMFAEVDVASNETVATMARISESIDEMTQDAEADIGYLIVAWNVLLQGIGWGIQTIAMEGAWMWQKLTGHGKDFYAEMKKQNDDWAKEIIMGVAALNGIGPDGKRIDKAGDQANKRKLAVDAAAADNDNDFGGKKAKDTEEGYKKQEEMLKRQEARAAEVLKKRAENEKKSAEDIAKLRGEQDVLNEDDPKKKREIERKQQLLALAQATNEVERERARTELARINAEERTEKSRDKKEKEEKKKQDADKYVHDLISKRDAMIGAQMSFDVDSFRARGGGGRAGTGGNMSSEIRRLDTMIQFLTNIDKHLAHIKGNVKNKGFK